MREDAPAARMTPANEGERAMGRTISYLVVEEIVYATSAVDKNAIAKIAKIAKNRVVDQFGLEGSKIIRIF
jgi:hypothetical protein